MRVRVRWFAALRERRGTTEEEVELPEGLSAREAYARLAPPAEVPVAYVVNGETVPASTRLGDGDEVAFLPPVGGG